MKDLESGRSFRDFGPSENLPLLYMRAEVRAIAVSTAKPQKLTTASTRAKAWSHELLARCSPRDAQEAHAEQDLARSLCSTGTFAVSIALRRTPTRPQLAGKTSCTPAAATTGIQSASRALSQHSHQAANSTGRQCIAGHVPSIEQSGVPNPRTSCHQASQPIGPPPSSEVGPAPPRISSWKLGSRLRGSQSVS